MIRNCSREYESWTCRGDGALYVVHYLVWPVVGTGILDGYGAMGARMGLTGRPLALLVHAFWGQV